MSDGQSDSDKDWRSWAYLQKDNWPECIPWTYPKREYGPYPFGKKTHHDPHDLDTYPASNPTAASVGETYMGDVCPWCGVPLDWLEDVVLITGARGTFADVDDSDDPTPAYHPDCWQAREAERRRPTNRTLTEFGHDGH